MWYNIIIVVILLIISGTCAGLTLALFGIKLTTLERKIRLGDKRAEKVYQLRKHGNLLLCSLLLGNVASYTIMAIFLGSITTGIIASLIATSLIFIFGEIVPQAFFPRHALVIGANFFWLIWIIMILFYPIAAPIAWLLDKILGKEPPVIWTKRELEEIIRYHKDVNKNIIDKDEERIVLGALSFSGLKAKDVMIPFSEVFYLETGTKMSELVLNKIRLKSFSRIPIYDSIQKKITGILYSKSLIGLSGIDNKTVDEFCSKDKPIIVSESTMLDNLLNQLVQHKIYMSIVTNSKGFFCGVATFEDVMEEILKIELEDIKR